VSVDLSRRQFVALGSAGAACAVTTGCQENKELGRSQFILVPDSVLENMGAQAWSSLTQQASFVKGTQTNRRLEQVGTRIADASGLTDTNWEFAVIDNQVPNAFVLPGGKVAFHSGIFPLMDNDAQIATVMGHEAGHVAGRHAAERMSQQLAAQGLMVGAAYLASGHLDPEIQQIAFAALGAGVTYGLILPYSRQHEYEADSLGLKYMANGGYDPRDAGGFWQNMIQLSKGREKPPEFLSTHPADEKRLAAIQEMAPELVPVFQRNRA